MSPINSKLPRLFAVTAIVGGLAFAAPAYAATASTTSTTTTTSTTKPSHKPMTAETVEDHIKALHDKLNITPDQEEAFGTLAQAMRDNEASLKSLIDERRQTGETRTAVEDLESYQKIAQAHADGFGKVADAFKPLYDSFSDDQKKNADMVFGRYEGHRDSTGTPATTAKKG